MKKSSKTFVWTGFTFYMAILFYLLFFSAYRNGVKGIVDYNLIPLHTILRYINSWEGFSLTDEFFGNILAFLPFGFFMSLLFGKLDTWARIAATSFFLSLCVECAQFTLRVGAFDVDDLILNTLGGMIGFGFFALSKIIFSWRK